MMNKIKIAFFLICVICTGSYAQDNVELIKTLDALKYGADLPEDILQTKAVAIVQIPPKSLNPLIRGDWKKLAEEVQPGFKKAGLDVVTYYHVDDIYSGKEAYNAFIEGFKERELDNVVFVVQDKGEYRIVLTKLGDEGSMIKKEIAAWQTRNSDLGTAMSNLYKATANSPQTKQNLLILEVPEYGLMPETIKGRRGEYYDVNFSSEKLAVPMFADTATINKVMQSYPYKYGIVDPNKDEKQVRADGYQYILYYLHSTGKSVKHMLEYPVTDTETAYVSEVVKDGKTTVNSYSTDAPVYKFYIKHIYTGNIFLGKKWDAAPEWQQALSNYIDNLRTELIRK